MQQTGLRILTIHCNLVIMLILEPSEMSVIMNCTFWMA